MHPIYEVVNGSSEYLDLHHYHHPHPASLEPPLPSSTVPQPYWQESVNSRFFPSRNRTTRHQPSASVTISSISRSPSTPSFQALVQSENQLNSTFIRDAVNHVDEDGFFSASEYGSSSVKRNLPLPSPPPPPPPFNTTTTATTTTFYPNNINDYDSGTHPDNYYFRTNLTPPPTSAFQNIMEFKACGNSQATCSSNTLFQQPNSDSYEMLLMIGLNPRAWTVDQVCSWLCTVGLESIMENFKYHEITGAVLMDLDVQTMKELDILPFGKRYMIMQAISNLKNASQSAVTATESMENDTKVAKLSGEMAVTAKPFDYYEDLLSNQGSSTVRSEVHPNFPSQISATDNKDERAVMADKKKSKFTLTKMFQKNPNKEVVEDEAEIGNTRYTIKGSEMQVVAPDYQGWLNFSTRAAISLWRKRWFVLKGDHLYYAKESRAAEVKSLCTMYGYRLTTDPDVHRGNYGFVISRSDSVHRFSCSDPELARKWIRVILKATIDRDPFAHTVTSSTVPTVPLHVARAMHARPKTCSQKITPSQATSNSYSKIRHISLPINSQLEYRQQPQPRMGNEISNIPEGSRVSGLFRNGIKGGSISEVESVFSTPNNGGETVRARGKLERPTSNRWSTVSRRSRNYDNDSVKS